RHPRAWIPLGVAFSALCVVSAAACSSSTPKSTTPPTSVSGLVTDAKGQVLAGVKVSAGGSTTQTAANGTFTLAVAPKPSLVVDFTKDGFLETSKLVVAKEGQTARVAAALMAMAPMQPLDATQGGTVTGDRGASLTAAPGMFVDGSGKAVSGMVEVAL